MPRRKCHHEWELQLPELAKKVPSAKDYEICKKCLTRRQRVHNSSVRNWKYKYYKRSR